MPFFMENNLDFLTPGPKIYLKDSLWMSQRDQQV